MGKPRIVKVGHSTPVGHVTWKVVRSGGRIIERLVNAPPQKKVQMGGVEQSPTQGTTFNPDHATLFPDVEPTETCPITDDVPMQSFRLPRNQEWFPYKEVFLSVLHDMEAPPNPWSVHINPYFAASAALLLMSCILSTGLKGGLQHVLKTSPSGYKLHRVVSNAFPHLVPPGINILPEDNIDMSEWKYSQVIVMDGNFKAEHMALKNTDSEFWLMDGHRYMRSDCSNHHMVNQANANRGHLASTEIDMGALYHMPWWIFKRGSSRQKDMDYAFIHAIQHQMQPTQRVIHFYDINSGVLTQRLQATVVQLEDAENTFRDLNTTLPDQLLNQYTPAAPSIKSIEMDLMDTQGVDDDLQGSATWITHGFNIEEAQIALKLDAHQMSLQAMESSGWNGDI
ncbi:hypothetical protein J3A83DRAFT_4189812 [Scleroderma citrinum]